MTSYRTDSVYRNTGIVNNKYLDVYEPGSLDLENTSTVDYVLTSKHNNRPDVLAHELYGNAKLWCVFAQFNPDMLNDPIIDFVSGLKIKVPTRFT